MMRCLLVDDEKLALELMEDNVQQVPFLELKGKCKNAIEAMEFLRNQPVDLIFLDIQMPGISGIQFLNTLTNPPMVIMVTAYENYAMDGFNLSVVDYLLKPVAFDRFLKAVNKAHELFTLRQQKDQPVKEDNNPDYLFVNADYSVVRINIPEISFIEGLKDYIKIHLTTSAKPVITRLTMRYMEERLPEKDFARVHKSFIVALDKVRSFKKTRLMIGDNEIPVSDSYSAKILSYIGLNEQNLDN